MANESAIAPTPRFVKGSGRRRKTSVLDRPADVPPGAAFTQAEPDVPELEPVQEPVSTPVSVDVPEPKLIGVELPMPDILGLDLPEKPPSPAAQWSVIRVMADKLQAVILRIDNQSVEARRALQARWQCSAMMLSSSGTMVSCDYEMFSTPPGQPKVPPLICPRHGASPFFQIG